MPDAWDHFAPVKLDLFRVLAVCQLALFAVKAGEQRGASPGFSRPGRVPALVPAGAILALGTAAVLPALWGHGKPLAMLDLLLSAGLFTMLVHGQDRALAGKMLAVNALSAGLASAYGLGQYFGLDMFSWRTGFAGSAPGSTFGNPLFLADSLASALPFALAGLLSERRNVRTYSLFLVVTLSAGLLTAQARGAWAGALAGLAVFIFLVRREAGSRKAWFMALGACLAMLLLFAAFPRPDSPEGTPVMGKIRSLWDRGSGGFRGRFLLWESTARMVRDNPVYGAGAGEFSGHFNIYQGPLLSSTRYAGLEYHSTGHAHQDYLQIAAESGVLGLGIFLWLVMAVLAGFSRDQRNGLMPRHPGIRAAALGGLAVLLVDAFFNGPFHVPPSAQWAWMLAGVACISWGGRGEAGWKTAPRRIPRYLYLLAVLACVAAVRPFARDLAGEACLRSAHLAFEEGRLETALVRAIDSFALSTGDRRHRFLLGKVYFTAGRYGDSAEQFAADAEENPGMASAWHNLGLSLLRIGRSGEAVRAFHRAGMLDPTDASIPGLIREAGKGLGGVNQAID